MDLEPKILVFIGVIIMMPLCLSGPKSLRNVKTLMCMNKNFPIV